MRSSIARSSHPIALVRLLLVAVLSCAPLAHAKGNAEVRALVSELDHQTCDIGGKDFQMQDLRRHKKLLVRALYPLGPGPFPVIIFSHGVASSRQGYAYLTSYWAKHGYVCLQPSHADSIKLMLDEGKSTQDLLNLQKVVSDKQAWVDRAADVSFLLDRLGDILPELKGKIDPSRVGVSGHSLGAFTTMLLCGAGVPHPEWRPANQSVKDSRVKAAVAISPPGIQKMRSALGFSDEKSYTIDVPTLFLTGDRDIYDGNSQENPQAPFLYATSGDKYLISISGANHLTFLGNTGREKQALMFGGSAHSLMGTPGKFAEGYGNQEEHRRLAKQATLLFWDAYLRDDLRAKKLLRQEGFSQLVGSSGQTKRK